MPNALNLTGQKFGRLTVLALDEPTSYGARRWDVVCECGVRKVVLQCHLTTNKTQSCGCLRQTRGHERRTHGASQTPTYRIWRGIIARCYNPNVERFDNYGGRGVKVCDAWRHDFSAFLRDMGERPSAAHSIERNDSGGDYEPANCRWALPLEQATNKRNTRYVVYRGKRMALTNAVRLAGSDVHYESVWIRIKSGWSVADAIETPVNADHPASSVSRAMRVRR